MNTEKYLTWDTRALTISITNMETIRLAMSKENCQRILIDMSSEELQMIRTIFEVYLELKDNRYKLVKDETGENRFIKLEET